MEQGNFGDQYLPALASEEDIEAHFAAYVDRIRIEAGISPSEWLGYPPVLRAMVETDLQQEVPEIREVYGISEERWDNLSAGEKHLYHVDYRSALDARRDLSA
jgi:hypothetical protein